MPPPAHCDLNDTVELVQAESGRHHQHAPPDHRADVLQSDLDLQDRLGGASESHRSRLPRATLAVASSAQPTAYPVASPDHPTLSDASTRAPRRAIAITRAQNLTA